MMRSFAVILLILTVALQAQQIKNDNSKTIKAEFQKRADAWKDAYNSNDAKALASFYTPDAKYVSGHVAGLVADGKDKIISNFQNGIKGGGRIESVEILEMDISGNLAYLLCRYRANNSGEKVEGRNVIILKKTGREWKFVLHASII